MSNDRRVAVAIANRAANIVGKIRGQQHGDAEESFRMIGEMWATYLRNVMKVKLGIDPQLSISPLDVANMMADVKKARSIYGDPNAVDNYVDQVGYTALAGMLALPGIPEGTEAPPAGLVQGGAGGGNTGTPDVDLSKMEEQMQDHIEPIPAFLRQKAELQQAQTQEHIIGEEKTND